MIKRPINIYSAYYIWFVFSGKMNYYENRACSVFMNTFWIESLAILMVFTLVLLWHVSPYALYSIPLLGLFTTVYLLSEFHHHRRKTVASQRITILLLTTSCLLLIFTTGGLNSYLFVLLYFLCFGVSTLLEPSVVATYAMATILIFLPEAIHGELLTNSIKLASLLLLAPIAFFFGKFIRVYEQDSRQSNVAAEQIIADVSEIVTNEGELMENNDLDKLHDIVEQSRRLKKDI